MGPGPSKPEDAVRAWVREHVIGLNLCPFARPVADAGTIRYVRAAAEDELVLLIEVERELVHLTDADPEDIATTLLVVAQMFEGEAGFLVMNDFMSRVEALLVRNRLDGVVQVPWFHPHFCFAGAVADDPANATNRAPFPVIHLLREADVEEALSRHPDADRIPRDNIERLRAAAKPKG